MEFLKRYFLQTRAHLKGLTLSQRLAIGSCAALILVSLLWLFQWGGEAELVPLLDQPLSEADFGAIQQKLDSLNAEYQVSGNTIRVPSEQRARLLAKLSESQILPKDISTGFENLIKESTVWMSENEMGWRRSVALGNELAKIVRRFDGVEDASVIIGNATRRTVSGPPITPTASISIRTRPGVELDPQRAYAMANLVCRTVPGLDITKVAVTDTRTNRSVTPPSADEIINFGTDLADRQKKEEYFAGQIRGMLGVPGVLVAVRAELDQNLRKEVQNIWTKPSVMMEKNENMIQSRGMPMDGPGVVPNTSKAVGGTSANDRTEETNSESTYEQKLGGTVTIESARNGIKSLAATVNVPRSYIVAIFKRANANKEPTETELKPTLQEEVQRIEGQVRTILGAKNNSDAVSVGLYHDDALIAFGPGGVGAAEAGAGGDVLTLVRQYGSKAGMGALAAFSLLMMLMMVRKVGEGPVLPGEESPKQLVRILTKKQGEAEEEEEAEVLTVNGPPVGEAAAHEELLVGHEVDESTLRIQQIVQQLAEMVKEDPKTSAGILERWIQADQQ